MGASFADGDAGGVDLYAGGASDGMQHLIVGACSTCCSVLLPNALHDKGTCMTRPCATLRKVLESCMMSCLARPAGQYKVTRRGAGLAALVREALGEAVSANSTAVAGLMAGAVRDIASLLAAPPPAGQELQVGHHMKVGYGRWSESEAAGLMAGAVRNVHRCWRRRPLPAKSCRWANMKVVNSDSR